MTQPIIHLVGTECPAGEDERFNRWYSDHIHHLLDVEGLEGARRFRRIGDDASRAKYLTIYEFRSLEDFRAYNSGPILQAAEEERHKFWNGPGFTVRERIQYELISKFSR